MHILFKVMFMKKQREKTMESILFLDSLIRGRGGVIRLSDQRQRSDLFGYNTEACIFSSANSVSRRLDSPLCIDGSRCGKSVAF